MNKDMLTLKLRVLAVAVVLGGVGLAGNKCSAQSVEPLFSEMHSYQAVMVDENYYNSGIGATDGRLPPDNMIIEYITSPMPLFDCLEFAKIGNMYNGHLLCLKVSERNGD